MHTHISKLQTMIQETNSGRTFLKLLKDSTCSYDNLYQTNINYNWVIPNGIARHFSIV